MAALFSISKFQIPAGSPLESRDQKSAILESCDRKSAILEFKILNPDVTSVRYLGHVHYDQSRGSL